MHTQRVKVSFNRPTLEALRAIAKERGESLSHLIAGAAIATYIGNCYRAPIGSSRGSKDTLILKRLSEIEQKMNALTTRKKRWDPNRLGVLSGDRAVLGSVRTPPTRAKVTGDPVHIDHLIERFGSGSGLKARLCQTGGRDGLLFRGSIVHAERAYGVTQSMDPDGCGWLPVSSDRVWWRATDPVSYCIERLQQSPNHHG